MPARPRPTPARPASRWSTTGIPATRPPGGVARGTVLPVEGGPGYPSIGSVRGGFDAMYGPLLADRNLLAVDLRGTGGSKALDCPGLQHFVGRPSGPAFAAAAGVCGRVLDHRWRTPPVTGVPAVRPVHVGPGGGRRGRRRPRPRASAAVDLYGDSYGSWFAQVLAGRYPAAVPVGRPRLDLLDRRRRPLVPEQPRLDAGRLRRGVPTRRPPCAAAEPGPAWDRIDGAGRPASDRRRCRAAVPDASRSCRCRSRWGWSDWSTW